MVHFVVNSNLSSGLPLGDFPLWRNMRQFKEYRIAHRSLRYAPCSMIGFGSSSMERSGMIGEPVCQIFLSIPAIFVLKEIKLTHIPLEGVRGRKRIVSCVIPHLIPFLLSFFLQKPSQSGRT